MSDVFHAPRDLPSSRHGPMPTRCMCPDLSRLVRQDRETFQAQALLDASNFNFTPKGDHDDEQATPDRAGGARVETIDPADDLEVLYEGRVFRVSRAAAKRKSAYFRNMLGSDFMEGERNNRDAVQRIELGVFAGFGPHALGAVLTALSAREDDGPPPMDVDAAYEFVLAADYLQVNMDILRARLPMRRLTGMGASAIADRFRHLTRLIDRMPVERLIRLLVVASVTRKTALLALAAGRAALRCPAALLDEALGENHLFPAEDRKALVAARLANEEHLDLILRSYTGRHHDDDGDDGGAGRREYTGRRTCDRCGRSAGKGRPSPCRRDGCGGNLVAHFCSAATRRARWHEALQQAGYAELRSLRNADLLDTMHAFRDDLTTPVRCEDGVVGLVCEHSPPKEVHEMRAAIDASTEPPDGAQAEGFV